MMFSKFIISYFQVLDKLTLQNGQQTITILWRNGHRALITVCVCVGVWDINLLWRLPLTPLHRERSYVDFPPSLPEVSRVAFVAKPTPASG